MRSFLAACAALLAAGMVAAAPPIAAPGGFIPQHALAFGETGSAATAVTPQTPLPASDAANAAFTTASAFAADQPVAAGRSLLAICSASGIVALVLAGGDDVALPVQTGVTILPFAVTLIQATGTSATCNFANLK